MIYSNLNGLLGGVTKLVETLITQITNASYNVSHHILVVVCNYQSNDKLVDTSTDTKWACVDIGYTSCMTSYTISQFTHPVIMYTSCTVLKQPNCE